MSGFKDVMKGGWHPKGKNGGKESWRGDFKGINQVAGWLGHGKEQQTSEGRTARPISSLRDPASFAPPPKNVHAYGESSSPTRTASSTDAPRISSPYTRPSVRGGLGAPLTPEQIRELEAREEEEARLAEEERNRPKPPPAPFRVDTTGLSTSNLPSPPTRRPQASEAEHRAAPIQSSQRSKPSLPPSLPPRLPPRQNSSSSSLPKNQSQNDSFSRGALDRLGHAGISVPGFNIGKSQSQGSTAGESQQSRQSRFGDLRANLTRTSSTSPNKEAPTKGTTFAEKKAALQTMQSFQKDPTSVSLSDARSAAVTANNFRERHGDQVTAGLKSANNINQKYGIANRLNGLNLSNSSSSSSQPEPANSIPELIGKKKPPPPPPKRKSFLNSNAHSPTPPPIPMSSKPRP